MSLSEASAKAHDRETSYGSTTKRVRLAGDDIPHSFPNIFIPTLPHYKVPDSQNMALNLEKQLLFYGAYHHDPVNVAIHIVCVPILLFTGIILACAVQPLFTVPDVLSVEYLPANIGTIGAFLYTFIYILLEPVAGISFAPFVIGSAVCGNYLLEQYGKDVIIYTGIIHVVSWIAQFVGHGKFEGRAPALLDNLVQALLLAPLFVWMKVLFFFGYRPELKQRMDEGVEAEIKKFRSERELKKKGKTAN